MGQNLNGVLLSRKSPILYTLRAAISGLAYRMGQGWPSGHLGKLEIDYKLHLIDLVLSQSSPILDHCVLEAESDRGQMLFQPPYRFWTTVWNLTN